MIFYTESLLSKWGFGDGDMLDDLLLDNNIDIDSHDLLKKVVKEKLLPAIENNITLVEINCIHNPIRADFVDGIKINHRAENPQVEIRPELIEVEDSELLEMAIKI